MTGVPCYLVDTNILLRFLVEDDEKKAAAARRLINQAGKGEVLLEVPFITVVEAVHTLRSVYKVDKGDITREVYKFLRNPGLRTTAPAWLFDALAEFQARNISFGDACIAAEARAFGKAVASFDRDFDGFAGVRRFEPE